MKNITCSMLAMFCMVAVQAQNISQQKPATDAIMRSNGRIYVVVAVMLIILAGLILYLFRIDKKVSGIETELGGG